MSTVIKEYIGSIIEAMLHETDVKTEGSGPWLRCGAKVANQRALKRPRHMGRRCPREKKKQILEEKLGSADC